ncbi:diflavin oxidoreductase [Blattabacterium cuenoti]|uniref:diflavin oxidoreductase n=1 Tax=Blattabacterium cuenoti TaxID=1653831 RepID=UPI00163BB49E|nr:flavodoxin domain-containing protein [Blattabacterium cuenoti]
MLSKLNKRMFLTLIKNSSQEEIIWMYGYLSGFLSLKKTKKCSFPEFLDDKILNKKEKITIVYGTETGNSKSLAFDFHKRFKGEKIKSNLISLDKYYLQDLKKESYLLIIISTYGEGDPPTSAKSFFHFIHENEKKIILKNLKYSVLALGDKSYLNFCKAGYDVDKCLYNMGAKRIIPLYKCDVDYEEKANKWFLEILYFFQKNIKKERNVEKIKDNKICGIVKNNILLSKKEENGSYKEIHHIEISVNDKIKYSPGDSIGIFPENPSNEINDIVKYFTNREKNDLKEKKINDKIWNLFKKELNILCLSNNFLKKYSLFLKEKKNIPVNRKWKLIDLLKEFPVKKEFFLQDLIEILEPIKPRLYSISSYSKFHINEIHITVSRYNFQLNGKNIYGHCSDYLSKIKNEDQISFFVCKNQLFKLPKNSDINIILIGTGTGIAPFRSFLYEREATKARGKNWLFFGGQHFNSDFLYQKEIQNWKEKGIINRLSLSFSRDQKNKIYVQDKIWENRIDFFSWIKNGAYIYICGKKSPMSMDVEKMICRLIDEVGKCDPKSFIEKMKKNRKYLKDVY